MIKLITFNRIDYKLLDLSLLDTMDIAIIKFVFEKFGGKAPLSELNVITVITALAPKWQESISIPLLRDMVPDGILRALSSNFAERELLSRIQKLEQLGIIRIDRPSIAKADQIANDEQNATIYLTSIGKEIAQYNGLLLHGESIDEVMDKLLQLSIPLPMQEAYTINPREAYIAIPNEIIEVGQNQAILIKPVQQLSLLGVKFLNEVITGPFNGIPKIVIIGGYVPLTIRKGLQLGYVIPLNQ